MLHLVRSKLDQPDQASRALDISFATSTSVPKELYGQAVAELRRSEVGTSTQLGPICLLLSCLE